MDNATEIQARLGVLENRVSNLERGHDLARQDFVTLESKLDALRASIVALQLSLQKYLGFGLGAFAVVEFALRYFVK